MSRQHYRITYTTTDAKGRADFVRDVAADGPMMAIQQAEWDLYAVHADDHAAYVFERMERIDRRVRIDPPDDWSVTA